MHITNQKLSFDIFTVGNVGLLNIFMEHDLFNILMIFGINEKWIMLLAIYTHDWFCAPGSHVEK